MATLQQQIIASFLIKLDEDELIEKEKVEQLRLLLNDEKKLKADDVIKILSASDGGDVK